MVAATVDGQATVEFESGAGADIAATGFVTEARGVMLARYVAARTPEIDDDGPVVVLHLIRFHPGEADNEMVSYQDAAAQAAVPHGVRISGWFGVEGIIVGDGRQWDQARFNAFPSRAALMVVVTDPARLEAQGAHRETAIADTYTMIMRPMIDCLAESTGSTTPSATEPATHGDDR